MSNQEIISKVRKLHKLNAKIEEAKAEAEALKDEIKAYMGEEEILRAGAYKVTWKHVTSNIFNQSGFKADYPEIYADYLRESHTRRFTVA